jgi:hypothetical protein
MTAMAKDYPQTVILLTPEQKILSMDTIAWM